MASSALDAETRERLVEAERLATVGRLVPSVIHQMSTPLAAIALRAESLEQASAEPSTAPAPDKTRRYLKAMIEETERCREVLTVLREFAAPGDPALVDVDLAVLCRQATKLAHHAAMRHQLEIQVEADAGSTVRGSRPRLAQAILALLVNAIDASPKGGRISMEVRASGDGVSVSVTDEGEGVPEGLRPRLFEPFASSHPPEGGLGIGLMACRVIAEEHGGAVALEPTSSRGSRFVLHVPAQGHARS